MRRLMCLARHRAWQGLVLLVVALVLSSCGGVWPWKGISNVQLPGGPGSGGGSYTVYVQMPDTLAINGNSKVMVADVFVGSIRKIELKNWVATLTLGLDKNVQAAEERHRQDRADQPAGFSAHRVGRAARSVAAAAEEWRHHPAEELVGLPQHRETLASLAMIVRGGGLPNLETLQNEINNILSGRGPQIRAFLGKLDTFTRRAQRAARRHHPRDRLHQPAAGLRGHPVGCAGSGIDRIPAADQVFRE